MKKLLSMILSAALLIGVFTFPTAADGRQLRYYDVFNTQYCEGRDPLASEWEGFVYEEVYYHQAGGETDWALIRAETGLRLEVELERVLFGRAIAANDIAYPFEFLYGIYDAKQERFFDLKEIEDEAAYPDLQEILDRFEIGQRIGVPQYGENLLFKQKFLQSNGIKYDVQDFGEENTVKCYDELYYHESGDVVDWALVKGETWFKLPYGGTYNVIADRVFRTDGILQPYGNGYAVYEVSSDSFFWLQGGIEKWRAKDASLRFPGLKEALERLNIGERIGDLNADGYCTINDATEMQRCLAEFCDFPENDGVEAAGYRGRDGEIVQYISDVNKDGRRDIRDVTEMQRKLAEN